MKPDCKSVIRRFESDLGLSKNTGNIGDSASSTETSDNRKLPDTDLTNGASGCGRVVEEEWLYAIRQKGEMSFPVKFGISRNFERRFQILQTGSAFPLAKIAVVPGGRKLETAIHLILAPWRMSGEWFGTEGNEITSFARLLKEEDFRAAIIRWIGLPEDFKKFLRGKVGLESDVAWLKTLTSEIGGLRGLLQFVDVCGEHAQPKSPTTRAEGVGR